MDQDDGSRFNNLYAAFQYLLMVVDGYQFEIRNSKYEEWVGVDLEAVGFCQGRMYLKAQEIANKVADGLVKV